MGHIARVCSSKTAVVTQQQSDESAVVPVSQSSKQPHLDIPPMFQISTPYSDAEEVMPDG